MKTTLLLSLALALPVFTSCGEATDAAAAAAKTAGEAVDMDAGAIMGKLTEGLAGIKDVASAEKFKGMAGPLVETLTGMKEKLGTALPGADALKSALGAFKMEGGIGDIVGPIIEKLKALVM